MKKNGMNKLIIKDTLTYTIGFRKIDFEINHIIVHPNALLTNHKQYIHVRMALRGVVISISAITIPKNNVGTISCLNRLMMDSFNGRVERFAEKYPTNNIKRGI